MVWAPSDARAVAYGAVLRRCRGNWCCGGTPPAAGLWCMRLGQGAAGDGAEPRPGGSRRVRVAGRSTVGLSLRMTTTELDLEFDHHQPSINEN